MHAHHYAHILTQVGEAPVPSRILNATKSSQRNASGPFKPSVLSTKNVSLNFRQSLAKTGTAEVRKGTLTTRGAHESTYPCITVKSSCYFCVTVCGDSVWRSVHFRLASLRSSLSVLLSVWP